MLTKIQRIIVPKIALVYRLYNIIDLLHESDFRSDNRSHLTTSLIKSRRLSSRFSARLLRLQRAANGWPTSTYLNHFGSGIPRLLSRTFKCKQAAARKSGTRLTHTEHASNWVQEAARVCSTLKLIRVYISLPCGTTLGSKLLDGFSTYHICK